LWFLGRGLGDPAGGTRLHIHTSWKR
jgi:hypothetical protein